MKTMNTQRKQSLPYLRQTKHGIGIAVGILLFAQEMEGALLDTKWTVSTASGGITSPWIHSSAAISTEGLVYMGGGDNTFSKAKFYALDPADAQQQVRWTYPAAAQDYITVGTIVGAPAIGLDGTIYFGIRGPYNPPGGRFYALNPGDAPSERVKWQVDTDLPVETSPAVGVDGTIYVGAGRQALTPGRLYAFYPDAKGSAAAQQKWRYPQTGAPDIGPIIGSPAIGTDGTIYFGTATGQFYAIKPDGTEKWAPKFATSTGPIISSPAIGPDGTVYMAIQYNAQGNGLVYGLHPESGAITHARLFSGRQFVYSSPIIGHDDTLYICGEDGSSTVGYALDLHPRHGGTGSTVSGLPNKWASPPSFTGQCRSTLALAADGILYVGRDHNGVSGGVVAINSSGAVIKNRNLGGANVFTSPALGSDGTVYVGDEAGDIYALEGTGSSLASSFWPKYRRNPECRANGSVLRYAITDLGTLADQDANGMALNNFSQVVGQSLIYRTSGNGGWNYQNFWWEDGQMFDNGSALTLVNYSGGFPYRIHNFSTGVNGNGDVCGYVTYGSSGKRAFRRRDGIAAALFQSGSIELWTEPNFQILTPISAGGEAHDIDEQGNIVGWSYNSVLSPRATLWLAGQSGPNDLRSLIGAADSGSSYAFGVSLEKFGLFRLVAGKSVNASGVWRGYVTQPGQTIQGADDIGAFGTSPSSSSEARDVNRLGYVVGTAQLDNGWSHAFIKKPGTAMGAGFADLAGSSVAADSLALALNSYQQVVGGAGGTAFVHLTGWSQWQDLNGLIPSGSGWLLLASANDINDRGEVTGWGWRLAPEGAVYRAFLLTPVP